MQIREGSCLSVLGLVSLNLESGLVEMTELTAVMAGGVREAREYLKKEISATRGQARFFGFLGGIAIISALAISYFSYIKNQQHQQLQESLKKSKMDIHRMPTVKAEEMGTHCLICYSQPSNIVLIPCNHLCICSDCFLKLKESNNAAGVKCPMCRLDVDLKH